MRKLFLVLLLPAIVLVSCQSGQAFNYSEKIVAIERSMGPDLEKAEATIVRVMQEDQVDSLVIVSEQMEKLVDSKLAEVMQLKKPDAKEIDPFQASVIRYFRHIKNIFTTYKQYGSETDAEKKEAARQRMIDTENETNEIVSQMKLAQEKFAEANGFKIGK